MTQEAAKRNTMDETKEEDHAMDADMNGAKPSSAGLTKKFSRSSLKNAVGHTSAKVHSMEEEIARARNRRFASDSWKRVSEAYCAHPVVLASNSNINTNNSNFSVPETNVLNTMSSLTEDPAFVRMCARENALISNSMSYSTMSKQVDDPTISNILTAPTESEATASTPGMSLPSMDEDDFRSADGTRTRSPTSICDGTRTRSPTSVLGDVNKENKSVNTKQSLKSLSSNRRLKQRPRSGSRLSSPMKRDPTKVTSSRFRATPTQRSNYDSVSQPQTSNFSRLSLMRQLFGLLKSLLVMSYDIFTGHLFRKRWSAKGKTVLVTGASSGIGAEIARQYASQGAKLVLMARTKEDLQRVANECKELGSSKVFFYSADLSNPTSIMLAMKQAKKDFDRFDVVVLNAGRNQGCYFEEIKDVSQIDAMIKLNITGTITTLHHALHRVPKSQNSRIVIVSSTAGVVAAPYQTVYSATKHALTGFANSLRIELGNTYGAESPRVCVVNFPEVSGTKSNTNRMDMGARLPPAKWYSWAGIPLPLAIHDLLPAVAAGKREFGPNVKFNLWRSLYALCPGWIDALVMKEIQLTHYRPLDENHKLNPKAGAGNQKEVKVPVNRSY